MAGRFVTLSSGMILNTANISVIQTYRHENGAIRHARVWMNGTPHNDAYELSHTDANILLDFLKEHNLLTPAPEDAERR